MRLRGLLPRAEAPFDDRWNPLSDTTDLTEGALREHLAAYFLSQPPAGERTPAQREEYRRALRTLSSLENNTVIRLAGHNRPLQFGDLSGLLDAVAQACCRVAAGHGIPLHYMPDETAALPCFAPFEPRLVQMAAVGLIRAACMINSGTPVHIAVTQRDSALIFSVTGLLPAQEKEALLVAKEPARLHQGSLAVCNGTVAISLRRATAHYACVFPGVSPGELISNPLSSVQVGFCSALE